jgi:LmbE family N-acetylglucosaminyl deacetylase
MRILAVGCHPDDLEIGCGGTLAKYASAGHEVFSAHVANGCYGHAVIEKDELREIRHREAERAGELLGVKEVIDLDVDDLAVSEFNEDTVLKMTGLIRYVRPDVIITHSPEDYMRDHVQTGRLVFNASFSSSVPHYLRESPAYGKVCPIYYMDTLAGVNFLPTEYVDVSAEIEKKLSALACHESQIKWMLEHDKIDFIDFVRTCSKFRGLQCGAAFAEGFRRCDTWPRIPTARLLP